jgi:glycosyltransferase involved in cell wall biosynthesis
MNIIYLNSAEKGPSGGMKVIYNHSCIINKLKIQGVTSEVLHLKKNKISKFKNSIKKIFKIPQSPGWKFSDISISKNHRNKWINNVSIVRNKFDFNPKKDFIILPEIFAHLANDMLIKKKIKYAIFLQNGYSINFTSDYDKLINAYKNAEFIISCSEDISKCARFVFNIIQKKIIKVNVISLFYKKKFNKKNLITYMPRKLINHSNNVLFFLKSYLPKNWSIKPIHNLNEIQVFNLLKRSRIFLSFSDMEGLGLPPIEAASLGNKVVGYTGQGGNEYWKHPLFEKIEHGNIIKFCKTILNNISLINNKWIEKTSNERKKLIKKYSAKNEKLKILKLVKIITRTLNI